MAEVKTLKKQAILMLQLMHDFIPPSPFPSPSQEGEGASA